MKGLVVFKGKYGTTERYATWIGESLALPVKTMRETVPGDLEAADYLVIGSAIHMSKLTAARELAAWWPRIRDKPVFFFSTSGMPAERREELEAMFAASVPERRPGHRYFPASGAIDYAKYPFPLRVMMRAVVRAEYRKSHPGKALPAELGRRPEGAVDRRWIEPLLAEVRKL